MTLLLLLRGAGAPPFSASFAALVQTAPIQGNGYPIQRDTPEGVWKFVLELADPMAGDAIVWHDITRFYLGDRYQRGADTYKGKARAAQAIVDLGLDNLTAADIGVDINMLAPWGQDTTDLFGTDITLDAGLLMRAAMTHVVSGVVTEWFPIWTGRVETWGDASGARGQLRRHTVTVGDLMSDLVNVPVQFDQGEPTSPWEVWFGILLPLANWLFGVDIYGDTGSPDLPIDQDELHASALALMDQGADPLGLVWRTLRSGRIVIHPAPWDTTMTNRYTNPLLDVYPDGVKFNYAPDVTDVEYLADDDVESFGVQRTSLGITNSIIVTSPGPVTYPIDDLTSIQKFGYKPLALSWIVANDAAADDLLADRAFSSSQALPLRTTLDHEGFWPALLMLDHLDPVTVVHATADEASTVTAEGSVRNIVEERTVRGDGLLSWQSTVQIDIDTATPAGALLPVENLALSADPSSDYAAFSWTNPVQPFITPTEVQLRMVGRSLIWFSGSYAGVGAQIHSQGGLNPSTQYMLQVRLVRREFGIVTAASAIRSVSFVTAAPTLPTIVPGDDDDSSNVDVPDVGCDAGDMEIQLQESADGITWSTIDSFTGTEIEQNEDGSWSVAEDLVNAVVFEDDKVYRVLTLCDGDIIAVGPSTDVPDSWDDPCADSAAGQGSAPFVTAIVYVPKICAPDTIKEAVSGIAGVHGDAYAGHGLFDNTAGYWTLIAVDTGPPVWEDTAGIVAYGELPATLLPGVRRDKSIHARVMIPDAEDCLLFETGAMRLSCVEATAGYRVTLQLHLVGGSTVTLPTSSVLTEGTVYGVGATYHYETGDAKIYVNGVLDNSVGGTDNVETITPLPIWTVGAPPGAWITDCALWDTVITDWAGVAAPTVTINQGASQEDPTTNTTIVFDVVFSEAVTGFATGDVTLVGTAGATTGTVVDSGDHIHFTVNVTGMTNAGTVIATIGGSVCVSTGSSVPNAASTSTDNTVTWIASPALWYDAADTGSITASGGFVTQWNDKSGNAKHLVVPGGALGGPATGSRTLNSLNVVDFTNTAGSNTAGNNRYLTAGSTGSSSTYTLFVVNVQDSTSGSNGPQIAAFGPPGSGNHGLLMNIAGGSTQRQFLINSGGTGVATGSSITNGTWTLTTCNVTGASAMTIRLDGNADGSGTAFGAPNASPDLAVGSSSSGTRAFDGAIGEIMVYRADLSSTDRDAVEQYLMDKWGL